MLSRFPCKMPYHVKKAVWGIFRGGKSIQFLEVMQCSPCPLSKFVIFCLWRCTRRRAVSHTTPKGGDANADHITYRAVHRYDYCEKQKPPPWPVTVSIWKFS